MKLTLRSTGGFTGPLGAVRREVDLDQLSDEQRQHAHQLVEAARVFDRPARQLATAPRPHDFTYQLTVADRDRSRELELQLAGTDAAMRALVDWIEDEIPPASDPQPQPR
jgi:hypothetical protein